MHRNTKDTNLLTIFLGGEVRATGEHQPGRCLDLDAAGRVVGAERHDSLETPERLELVQEKMDHKRTPGHCDQGFSSSCTRFWWS